MVAFLYKKAKLYTGDTYMKVENYLERYLLEYQNYKPYWNYEDGCVLIGCKQMYEATREQKYLDFIIKYLNDVIKEDGCISNYELEQFNIDSMNAGKVLFYIYDMTKEEKYRKAIEFLMERLSCHPRTKEGNFWHKSIYPYQVWLDGLYMAQPFYMEYETRFHGKENYQDILHQYKTVRKHMFDENKKLYYHGYDEAKVQPWCSKDTGLSKNFWLRSMGWYLMSLVDVIDAMSIEIYEDYREFRDLLREAVNGILQYQDSETNLFYQVIDHKDDKNNYLETSGSAMVGYTILKACRLDLLSTEKYLTTGIGIVEGLIQYKLKEGAEGCKLCDICHVAGLGPGDKRDGSVSYYLLEPRVSDDAKGVGPFMMAYAELLLSKGGCRSWKKRSLGKEM